MPDAIFVTKDKRSSEFDLNKNGRPAEYLYHSIMIKSFKHKGLEHFFCDGTKKGIQAKHAGKLETILDLLDAADTISVMNFSGSRLHLLQPKKNRVWAVDVSGNWRVTFKFQDGDAYDIDYVDYH